MLISEKQKSLLQYECYLLVSNIIEGYSLYSTTTAFPYPDVTIETCTDMMIGCFTKTVICTVITDGIITVFRIYDVVTCIFRSK